MTSLTIKDKYQRFEAWLRENGAQFDSLELREYDVPDEDKSRARDDEEEKKEASTAACIKQDSEMRGVHAKCHIPPNTVCMTIPRKCLITVEMGQATPLGQAILNSDLDLDAPKHIFLMIYILWDRKCNGASSFFFPYYEILPTTLKNMPVFWSRQELAALEGSHLLDQIADRNDAIAEDYHSICSVAPELQDLCTLDEFKWARMCVCSRNFGLQIDGHRTSALVPHADMLNHYRPRETKWTFDEDRQAFTITSLQSIPAGAQVYDSYGQKCNHRFLLNYGFAVEDNRELDGFCPNEVPIELAVSPQDPCFHQKVEFWTRGEGSSSFAAMMVAAAAAASNTAAASAMSATITETMASRASNYSATIQQQQQHVAAMAAANSCDLSPIKRVRVCISNNESTRLLFSLLRALACNAKELNSLCVDEVSPGLFSLDHYHAAAVATPQPFYRSCRDIRHPISLRNERAAMMLLKEITMSALSKYPTTLTQDVLDLRDEISYPRFSNKRHAKIQIRGEKEVLDHFLRWSKTALEVMDHMQDGDAFERILTEVEYGGLHHTIIRYCGDVLTSLRREEIKKMRRRS